MNPSLDSAICDIIEHSTGRRANIRRQFSASGGCINHAAVIELDDARRFFIKTNPDPLPQMFEREAEGLEAMAQTGAIRVPRPLGTGGRAGSPVAPFIVMECIEPGHPGPQFQAALGRGLAQLHLATRTGRFGFEHDNYIGSTPQPNGWLEDWVEFWQTRRLRHQLALARRAGLSDAAMDRLGERLCERLPELIGQPDEPACLLHGDLWGGNYLTDNQGAPVLIDPAAYYGRREADLAMTYLFGGFSPDFYAAYEEVWPLEPGAGERLEVYKLYHLLNHLNLFGSGYHSSCLQILRRLAG